MKPTDAKMHPMEAMVADYLNGHLSPTARRAFTEQLADDAQLRGLLAFEQRLQRSLRNTRSAADSTTQSTADARQWRAFADRIQTTPKKDWFNFNLSGLPWLIAGPALAAVLMLFVWVDIERKPAEVNDYELLSDPATHSLSGPGLRIVGVQGTTRAELEALLSEYQLEALTWHSQTLSVDVSFTPTIDVAALQHRLARDDRVRLVQRLGATP